MRSLPCLTLVCALGALSCAAAELNPDPVGVFPDFKIYDASGQPWRAAKEDWDSARQKVAHDPTWIAWLSAERATVDTWMKRHQDRVSWVAGWSHDFVSLKDASHLQWTEDIPGEEVTFFHSYSDPKVEITPKLFAAWVRLFRENHANMMERSARLYKLTGDEHFAAWAASQMDFYTNHLLEWAPARGGARLYWQTLTEATNLITYAHVVRLLGNYPAAERREHWHQDFFSPEVAVLNGTYQNIHNIACWHRSAEAQVALLFHDEALWKDAVDGKYGIRQQVAQGITADYLWVEQSFGYAGGVAQALTSLYTEASLYGRVDQFKTEMAKTEDLLLAPTYYRFPNGQLPNPADSDGIGRAPNPFGLAAVYRILPTTIGLQALSSGGRGARRRGPTDTPAQVPGASDNTTRQAVETRQRRGGGWDNLLDPPPAAKAPAPFPVVTSHNLEATRMAIIKSGGWQVFFHYGQITRSHTEAEALNYSAFFWDTDITHDPGTTGYGSPLHLGYHTRGLAQNELLVDGEGEYLGPIGERREWIIEIINPHWSKRGVLLDYSPSKVSASQPDYTPISHAKRSLEIVGNELRDTATIETTDGKDHQLGLALHLQGAVNLPSTFVSDPHFADGRPEPYTYWTEAKGAHFHAQAHFDVDYDGVLIHLTIEGPGDFKIWHASTPDVAPRRRQSFYIETRGKAATFTTRFVPAK